MKGPDKTPRPSARSTKRGQIVLALLLVVILVSGGLFYSQRHLVRLFVQSLQVPAPQPVHITPLAIPSSTVTPVQLTSADWTTYHANNAHSGFIADMSDPTHLTNLWKQSLDGAVY